MLTAGKGHGTPLRPTISICVPFWDESAQSQSSTFTPSSRKSCESDSQRAASQSSRHCASNEGECTSAVIVIFLDRSHPAFSVRMKCT